MTQLAALLAARCRAEPTRRRIWRWTGLRLCRLPGGGGGAGLHGAHPAQSQRNDPAAATGAPDRHPPRRWVVEGAHSWFNRFRRLLTRTEKLASHYLGFSHIAAILIIYRKVRHARLLSG